MAALHALSSSYLTRRVSGILVQASPQRDLLQPVHGMPNAWPQDHLQHCGRCGGCVGGVGDAW